MNPQPSPMRWPVQWKDPAALSLLQGSGIDCLLLDKSAGLGAIAEAASRMNLTVADAANVRAIKGDWPGIPARSAGSAGPTGVPWVDSNGWKVRLEAALDPSSALWVDASPDPKRLTNGAYALAVADAAAYGGRWIVTLDDALAEAVSGRQAQALNRWKEIVAATALFSGRAAWRAYQPRAVIGILSDFSGSNEFLSHELLNMLARANQQFRAIPKHLADGSGFKGLRALIYPDSEAPAAPLRKQLLAFADSGGLLIAGPKWGAPSGAPARDCDLPRYDVRTIGRGRIAIAKAEPDDPYIMANDSAVLISHRHELLRFWNVDAVGSYLCAAPDGSHALANLVFYASWGPRDATVRIAGQYREANLWTFDRAEPRRLELHRQKDGVEAHLPPVNQYAAIELEV